MSNPMRRWAILILLLATGPCLAQTTINVTTDEDELNSNTVAANGPVSKGCSLREAIEVIDDGSNANFPECTNPTSAPFTINLGGHTVVVNSATPNPSLVPPAMGNTYNDTLPTIPSAASRGPVIISGGDISCFTDPISNDGVIIFRVADGGDFSITGANIHDCTAAGAGIAIHEQGTSSLTLNTVTFTNIVATNGSTGGAVLHNNGNLTLDDVHFIGCKNDDGMGGKVGNGGALSISNVGLPEVASINNSTFLNNSAGEDGGAIYLSGTNNISMTNVIFTSNTANGDSSSNTESGGGAIYAGNVAKNGVAPLWLMNNAQFISNSAPNGTGGAILLAGSNLAYATVDFPLAGGIVDANFTDNSAGGPAPSGNDPRSGSGGAIYARGNLTVVQSSFVDIIGANSSTNSNGGAIAFYDPTGGFNLTLANVTLHGNTAALKGGAIANLLATTNQAGNVSLFNDTIDNNTSNTMAGGGAFFNGNSTPANVTASNTIFSNSLGAGGNCGGGPFTNANTNLQFPGMDCGAAIASADPVLGSPTIHLGPNIFVLTQDLGAGSAASGQGTQAVCDAGPVLTFDATGTPTIRPSPSGSQCDIGAYEASIVSDLSIAKTHADPFTQGDSGDTYTITVSNAGNDSTSGTVSVTDTLPAGLTATAITGTGWACILGTLTCTRSDTLASSSSYADITLTVDVSTSAAASVTNTAAVSGGGEVNTGNDSVDDPTNITALADLTIAKTHSDPFTQGDTGDTYMITVSNAVGVGPSSGMVSVVDTLPTDLTASAIAGSGWSCTLGMLTCTRSDVLASGSSYPAITVTVDVATNAAPSVTNSATVSGGGEVNTGNDSANDTTNITALPDLTIAKTHSDPFTQGDIGDTYTITVSNAPGFGPTAGTVSVVDMLPAGLTATAIAGTGWSCILGTLTCTRSDVLASGASYPVITLTLDVSMSAPASVTNTATVSIGAESNTGNDSVDDPTT
ncbi:MAG: choice-of-anchor Q domain-containing protein, partial [Rudaea sp.]